jgi:hypothetical protein
MPWCIGWTIGSAQVSVGCSHLPRTVPRRSLKRVTVPDGDANLGNHQVKCLEKVNKQPNIGVAGGRRRSEKDETLEQAEWI